MPAGTDLITWSPRKGTSGDDRYDPDDSAVYAGNSAALSAFPTVDELNSINGINQIIGEINRRNKTYFNTRGSFTGGDSYSAESYVSAGDRITASKFTTLKSAIDSIRSKEQQSAFSWTSFPVSAGKRIDSLQMLEMRKALATDFFRIWVKLEDTVSPGIDYVKYTDTAYPPDNAGTGQVLTSNTLLGLVAGQEQFGGTYGAQRAFCGFEIPAGIPTIGETHLIFSLTAYSFHSLALMNFTLELYRANTYQHPVAVSSWGSLDNAEYSEALSSEANANKDWTLTFTPSAGTNYTLIFCGNTERTHTNPGVNSKEAIQIPYSVHGVSHIPTGPYLKLYTA